MSHPNYLPALLTARFSMARPSTCAKSVSTFSTSKGFFKASMFYSATAFVSH